MSSKPTEPSDAQRALAEYIVQHLEIRNGGELQEALLTQSVASRRGMIEEIAWILANGGRPPNWRT